MTLTDTNVVAGVTGEVYVGPTTATYPLTAVAATTGFIGLGYLGPDGIIPKNDRPTKDLTAFQNAAVVKVIGTGAKRTYEFTLWETSIDTIEFAYGTTVTQDATEGTYTIDPDATGGRKKFLIDTVEVAPDVRREMFEGELVSLEESGWKNGEAVAYKCTVVAYTSSTVKDTRFKTADESSSSSSSSSSSA